MTISETIEHVLLDRDLERLLGLTDAAALLGVSKATLRKYSNEGRIKSYRIGTGKHRRFRKRDLLAFIEECA
jgi:excisionase family DNA binding protein